MTSVVARITELQAAGNSLPSGVVETLSGVAAIRVLLVDDNRDFRAITRLVLLTSEDIEVVGEAGDGEGSLEEVERLRPDVVVMDSRLPGIDGAEATRRILQSRPATRVVALSIGDDKESLRGMSKAGAHPVVLKGEGPEELSRAIRSAFDQTPLGSN